MPPRGSETARRRVVPIAPDRRSNPRGVGERTIIGEIDSGRESSSIVGLYSAIHGLTAQSRVHSLSEGQHAILATQVLVQHLRWTTATTARFPLVAESYAGGAELPGGKAGDRDGVRVPPGADGIPADRHELGQRPVGQRPQ